MAEPSWLQAFTGIVSGSPTAKGDSAGPGSSLLGSLFGGGAGSSPDGGGSILSTLFSGGGAAVGTALGGPGIGTTLGAAAGGVLGGLLSVFGLGGEGAGQVRRAAARKQVDADAALAAVRQDVLRSVPYGKVGPSAQLLGIVANLTPQARSELGAIVAEATSLGGLGSAFGERANYLQDVIKYTFTGETAAPKRYVPTLRDLQAFFTTSVPVSGGSAPLDRSSSAVSPVFYQPRPSYWNTTVYRPRFY